MKAVMSLNAMCGSANGPRPVFVQCCLYSVCVCVCVYACGIRDRCLDVNGISGNELADDGLALLVKASIMNEGRIHFRHTHRMSCFG